MKYALFAAFCCLAAASAMAQDDINAKAEALLGQMTLDEKIGQMTQADYAALTDKADIARLALGSVLCGGNSDPADNTPASWLKAYQECQAQALQSRLKVPILFGVDAVHGHNNVEGAVIFPHNVGLGASRNPALVEQAAHITAREVAGTGIRWTFAPCVAVARNERWGRTYESFSEDPALVAQMGAAAVRGLQGPRLSSSPTSVLACIKHYVGDGGTTDGIDQGNTETDEATLERVHMPGYVTGIAAGAGSAMASYSSFHGEKLHGHKHLLTDVLKGKLGFEGFIVSDWAAIDQLPGDYKSDVEASINAGIDMVMIPNGPDKPNNYVEFIGDLKALVAEGKVPMSRIDDAVRRILRVKLAMALPDNTDVDPALTSAIGSPRHREVAREIVRQTLVLLKNEKQTLPISGAKRIAVVGAAADDLGVQCGGWTIAWQGKPDAVTPGGTTILAALKQLAPQGTEVVFSPDGKDLQGADVALVVIGEPPYAEMMGDRKDLNLPDADRELVKAAKASGAKVATVLLSGRPLILGSALDDSDALLAAWLPGTEGQGVVDVLLGAAKPVGKLPHTWLRDMSQIPANHDEPLKGEPLFPFGFGLSY